MHRIPNKETWFNIKQQYYLQIQKTTFDGVKKAAHITHTHTHMYTHTHTHTHVHTHTYTHTYRGLTRLYRFYSVAG